MRVKGIILTALSALLFGFTPMLASITFSMGSNAETLTFYRNLLVIPIVFVIMLVRKTDFRISPKVLLSLVLVGVLGRGITTFTLYASYDFVGIGVATTLHFLYPVFVALICKFFFREKLGATKIVALLFATCGILFFLESTGTASLTGILLASFSGLAFAVYMVGMDKCGLKNIDPFKVSFYMAIAVAAAVLLYNIPTRHIVFNLPPKAMLLTLIIAICTSFLAAVLLQLGIKYLDATTAAIFCLFEPIASSVCGVFFLNEALSPAKFIGSVIILIAAAILSVGTRKKKKALQN